MGGDESRLNVSLIVRDNIRTLSADHNFGREGRAGVESNQSPSAYQPNALPLGQAGLHSMLSEQSETLNKSEGDDSYCYTVTARLTPPEFRRAVMRAVLTFH